MTAPGSLGRRLPAPPRSLGLAQIIFAVVLALRLIALARLSASAFALPSGGDMAFYHEWARRILHGQLTDHLAFYGLPLYAYFLAGVYRVFGTSPFVPAILQVLCDAGTAVLLYRISVRVFADETKAEASESSKSLFNLERGQWIGLIAAAGWALFVPAQGYSIVLMPTAFGVFAFWLVVWGIVKRDLSPGPAVSLIYGLFIGFIAMGIATILFAIPQFIAAIWLKTEAAAANGRVWRRRALASVLLLAGVVAGTSPSWLHNRFIARDPVFLSAHSGINFWIGNNPDATGYPRFPGLRAGQAGALEDSIDLAEAEAGRSLPRSQVSAFWAAKARAYIRHDFSGWLGLIGRKLANFWNAFEYDDVSILAKLRENGVTLPGLNFGIVAALSLPGLWMLSSRFPRGRWVLAAIALQLLAVLPVFVTERYRLIVVPGLLIAAATSLVAFYCNFARGRFPALILQAAVVTASAVAVAWPQRDAALWALEPYNSGSYALESGDIALARKKLSAAYAYAPRSAEVNFALGNLALAEKDKPQARSHYFQAVAINPAHPGAWNNLGVLALEEQQWELAVDCFTKTVQSSPRDAKAHYLLAKALIGVNDLPRAQIEITKAILISPEQPEFRVLKKELDQQANP